MDNEFDELLKEWKKHFSKSRQRDYYFNARTNESVWTYDEVKESVRQELKSKNKDNSQKTSSKPANHLSIRPTTSKADGKQSSETAKSVIKDTHENLEMSVDDDEEPFFYAPMDIDEIVENINEIRKDKQLDSTSSLNNLNIDRNNNTKPVDLNKLKIVLVLDTNIFISNLEKLNEISKSELKSNILFSVPWIVLQELDKLKEDKKYGASAMSSMSQRARKAIHFISKILESDSCNNFIFENAIQSQENTIMKCDSNDDKILKCALRLKIDYPNLLVILATNDKNLINKSIVSKIQAYFFDTLLVKLPELVQYEYGKKSSLNEAASQISLSTGGSILKGTQFEQAEKLINESMENLLKLVESQLSSLTFKFISLLYEIEMKKAYSDAWIDLLLHKPPWTLQTFLPNLKKSYQALFCFVNNSRLMNSKFESLIKLLDELNKLSNERNCNCIDKLNTSIKTSSELKSIYILLNISGEDSKYLNELNQCLEFFETCALKITNLFRLTQVFYQTPDIYMNNVDPNSIASLDFTQFFEPIWRKFNDMSMLTGNIQSQDNLESFQLNESKAYFYFIISNECLQHFRDSYENFLKGENENSLIILTHAIFVLLKLFDMDPFELDVLVNPNEEIKKFILIKSSMLKCFLPEFREAMLTGLNQLNEFQNRFKTNNKYFCNLNKHL